MRPGTQLADGWRSSERRRARGAGIRRIRLQVTQLAHLDPVDGRVLPSAVLIDRV